jgi:hypothetical protein
VHGAVVVRESVVVVHIWSWMWRGSMIIGVSAAPTEGRLR